MALSWCFSITRLIFNHHMAISSLWECLFTAFERSRLQFFTLCNSHVKPWFKLFNGDTVRSCIATWCISLKKSFPLFFTSNPKIRQPLIRSTTVSCSILCVQSLCIYSIMMCCVLYVHIKFFAFFFNFLCGFFFGSLHPFKTLPQVWWKYTPALLYKQQDTPNECYSVLKNIYFNMWAFPNRRSFFRHRWHTPWATRGQSCSECFV